MKKKLKLHRETLARLDEDLRPVRGAALSNQDTCAHTGDVVCRSERVSVCDVCDRSFDHYTCV